MGRPKRKTEKEDCKERRDHECCSEIRCVQSSRSIKCASPGSNRKFQLGRKGTFTYVTPIIPLTTGCPSVVRFFWPSRASSDSQTSKSHDEECLGIRRPNQSGLSLLA